MVTFTNKEYADIVFINGLYNGNALMIDNREHFNANHSKHSQLNNNQNVLVRVYKSMCRRCENCIAA